MTDFGLALKPVPVVPAAMIEVTDVADAAAVIKIGTLTIALTEAAADKLWRELEKISINPDRCQVERPVNINST